jgi:hypothetical protein
MGVKFNPFTGNLDLIDTTAAAGLDGQVQFNSSGLLDGSADFTWDDTGKVLDVGGDINLDDGGSFQTTLQLVTPTAARTITFPDATGTVGLVAGSSTEAAYASLDGGFAGAVPFAWDGSFSVDGSFGYNPTGGVLSVRDLQSITLTSPTIAGNTTFTGRFISSLNGAASAPPGTFTGTWFTGGTATTTKPQVLIEPTGTTSTAWSTSGTGLGVNAASGFGGRLLDLQLNGTSNFNVDSTGRTSFPLGTAALPALYPGADTNTGIYSPGADQVAVATNGAGRLFVDASGNVGFGTATPDTLAHLRGTANVTLRIEDSTGSYSDFTYNDSGTGSALIISADPTDTGANTSIRFNVDGSERLRITSAGLVGIGVTAPSSLLHLADAGNISVGTTTGTKIGTATTQKLGFYNATPVVQPAAVADATDAATVITQLNDLLAKLRTLGIIAT